MDVAARLAELAGADRADALLAGQREFDRLEWLGDSVLDVLVSRHLCLSEPDTVSVERLAKLHSALVKDLSLRRSAQRHTLPSVQPAERPRRSDGDSRGRQGDSIEAWIGAAWLTGGWPSAAEAVTLVVLSEIDPGRLLANAQCPVELPEAPSDVRQAAAGLGWHPPDDTWLSLLVAPVPFRRRLVVAGTAAVELAAAATLYAAHPGDDEGQLTRRRAALTSGDALTARARRTMPRLSGFEANDRLLLAVAGAALLEGGPTVGVGVAATILR